MANATITVPVTAFVPLGTGICPNGAFTATSTPPNRVTVNAANKIIVKNPDGHGNGRVKMDFVVVSAESPAKTYTVCGFIISNGGLNSPTPGPGNFQPDQVNDNVLTLINRYTKGRQTWKLYLAISCVDAAGVTQVGVVDPAIENSDAE